MIRVEMLATVVLIRITDPENKYTGGSINRSITVFAGWHSRIGETINLHIYAGFLMSLLKGSEIKPLLITNGEMSNYDAFLLSIYTAKHQHNNG